MEKGALRQRILWIVQEKGAVSATGVHEVLRAERALSLNTVQTVLNRLVAQGLLIRTGSRRRYLYEVHPSDEVIKRTAASAAKDLLALSQDLGLAYFVETIDQVRPEAIESLERLLQDRRAKGKPS